MFLFYTTLIDDQEDSISFEHIFHTYSKPMYRIARKILRDHHFAEDAVQNALFGIAKNIKSVPVKSETELRAYVFTAARNAAINLLKDKKEYDEFLELNTLTDIAADDVFKKIVDEQDYAILLEMISSLPIIYREVLMLRYVMELQPREISNIMGSKTGTVSQQITRGKKMLAAKYEKEVLKNG